MSGWQPMEDIGLVLVHLLLLGVGVLMIVLFVVDVRKGNRSKDWPNTSGSVISANFLFEQASADWNPSPVLNVVYTYAVSGKHFRSSDTVESGDLYDYFANAGRDDDPPGTSHDRVITVFFDPSQPQSAVLEPGIPKGTYFALILGGFMLLFLDGLLSSTWPYLFL